MNRWTKFSILIIIVGVVLLTINQIVYVPRFMALEHAYEAWVENNTSTAPPSPETFGLDLTSVYISGALGWLGSLFVFVGALYLVILLVAKILRRLNPKRQTDSAHTQELYSFLAPQLGHLYRLLS